MNSHLTTMWVVDEKQRQNSLSDKIKKLMLIMRQVTPISLTDEKIGKIEVNN